jgi:two-component system response regulator
MARPTMLLVEDNPAHVELTLLTLEENGADHEVIVARDGTEALQYLFCEGAYSNRPNDHPPELVMLDLNLPGLSGLEVMQRMRGDPRTFFVPVVILTSESKYSPVVKEIQGGLNSYVRKPLHFRDFQEKLEQVREYWRTSNFGSLLKP